ncbi:MAG: hypothetical protein V1800_02820 [Candidatus Latescibacterota bacterium]
MNLEFKPDFQRAQQMWEAFWKGENRRPLIHILIPKEGVKEVAFPRYLAGRDGNFQPVIDQALAWADTHEFIGEAIPFFFVEWGPDTFSSFLGADIRFTPEQEPDTGWCVPFVKDWDEVEIRFRRDSYWWQMTVNFFRELRRQCDGKLLIYPPTFVANLDSLAAIRGIENLLVDLVTCPDKVKDALDAVCRAHAEILEECSRELDFDRFGSMGMERTYCKGKQSRPQCDMSCMISPEMFREFVKPALVRETNDTDVAFYHLDGSGGLKHLEALCEIEKLDGISWIPSAGNEAQLDWSWLYRRIDELGKGFNIPIESHEEIENMWRRFKTRKIYIYTSASSKMEAEDLIVRLEKVEK